MSVAYEVDVDPRDPPAVLKLDAGAVGRLNWQPRWCPPPLPCIASRRGDVLELVFTAGPYDPLWRLSAHTRWRYQLEATDDEHVVIGRRIK